MEKTANKYMSLSELAARTRLPKWYLKQLAEQKAIPSLIIGQRPRFRLDDVLAVLKELAEKGAADE